MAESIAELAQIRELVTKMLDELELDAAGNVDRVRSCGLHTLLYRTRFILEAEIASLLEFDS